jgi:hypothetical protein
VFAIAKSVSVELSILLTSNNPTPAELGYLTKLYCELPLAATAPLQYHNSAVYWKLDCVVSVDEDNENIIGDCANDAVAGNCIIDNAI